MELDGLLELAVECEHDGYLCEGEWWVSIHRRPVC